MEAKPEVWASQEDMIDIRMDHLQWAFLIVVAN